MIWQLHCCLNNTKLNSKCYWYYLSQHNIKCNAIDNYNISANLEFMVLRTILPGSQST